MLNVNVCWNAWQRYSLSSWLADFFSFNPLDLVGLKNTYRALYRNTLDLFVIRILICLCVCDCEWVFCSFVYFLVLPSVSSAAFAGYVFLTFPHYSFGHSTYVFYVHTYTKHKI